jgi:hypothetical protein
VRLLGHPSLEAMVALLMRFHIADAMGLLLKLMRICIA